MASCLTPGQLKFRYSRNVIASKTISKLQIIFDLSASDLYGVIFIEVDHNECLLQYK